MKIDTLPGADATQTSNQQTNLIPEDERRIVQALVLEQAIWQIGGRSWKGASGSGLTDRAALIAALRVAFDHGKIIAAGVRFHLSTRQWERASGISSHSTMLRAKRKLLDPNEYGILRRAEPAEGPKSAAYVLLCDVNSPVTLPTELHLRTGVSVSSLECYRWLVDGARVPLRWGSGRTGKTKEAILDSVRKLTAVSDREVADDLDRLNQLHNIRKHLEELKGMGILERRKGERYGFAKYGAFALKCERAFNGEMEAAHLPEETHEQESEAFADAWGKGRVLSKQEQEKRRKNIAAKAAADRLKRKQRQAARAEFSRQRAATKHLRSANPTGGVVEGEPEPLPDDPGEERDASLPYYPAPVEGAGAGLDFEDGDGDLGCLADDEMAMLD